MLAHLLGWATASNAVHRASRAKTATAWSAPCIGPWRSPGATPGSVDYVNAHQHGNPAQRPDRVTGDAPGLRRARIGTVACS